MSIAEIVAELTNAGKSLAEIAGLTDVQMKWIYFRRRDKFGMLVRRKSADNPNRTVDGEIVIAKKVPFETMFRDLWGKRGLTAEQVEERWQKYLDKNPGIRERMERANKKRR